MNMRIVYLIIRVGFGLVSCSDSLSSSDNHTEEWQSIFNGVNLDGWTVNIANRPLGENFLETVVVEDSMLRVNYDNYENFERYFGHIYYKNPYSYYKIKFDYRFVGEQIVGGDVWNVRNSGLMFHSQSAESNEYGQHFPVSVEMQLLGGLGDGKERSTGNVCTPGTAVMMGDTINFNHCIKSKSQTYHGDQWVHGEAIVLGGESMSFLIEGDTVLSFQRPHIGGGFIYKNPEGKDFDKAGISRDKAMWLSRDDETLTDGYIALQAESHAIDFKNIDLLNLCGCMDPKAKNYKSYYVKDDREGCVY